MAVCTIYTCLFGAATGAVTAPSLDPPCVCVLLLTTQAGDRALAGCKTLQGLPSYKILEWALLLLTIK